MVYKLSCKNLSIGNKFFVCNKKTEFFYPLHDNLYTAFLAISPQQRHRGQPEPGLIDSDRHRASLGPVRDSPNRLFNGMCRSMPNLNTDTDH